MDLPDRTLQSSIALTRFGLGARPGEIAEVSRDPAGWLQAQIRTSGAPQPQGTFHSSLQRIDDLAAYRDAAQAGRRLQTQTPDTMAGTSVPPNPGGRDQTPAVETATPAQQAFDARQGERRQLIQDTAQEFLARTRLACTTGEGFAERWALFWSNTLTVSATKFQSAVFIGQYEREAIRPHVFGPFADLLLAAEQHPAMLLYLDQAQSIGPNSQAGRRRAAGLNENLARESLELHSVGAQAGYTQADVTELARALTGWSVEGQGGRPSQRAALAERGADMRRQRPGAGRAGTLDQPGRHGFVFRPALHEPGARTLMGRRYPQAGSSQGEAMLRDLASHPQTARRLAHRLAVHFVSDEPPAALVSALEAAWLSSGGRLDAVARALITAPEAWSATPEKIKTPYEFLTSTHRALGTAPQRPQGLQQPLMTMGQPAFSPPSPEGWPDMAADWAGPDAMVKRLEWASGVADNARGAREPVQIAQAALGGRLGERSLTAIARAESRPEALTLFLMSPEFQRR